MRLLLVIVLSLLCWSPVLNAHEPKNREEPKAAHQTGRFPAAMVLPKLKGPKPWSDKPVLNDSGRFHMAIMTDRTGGHRPGIWMQAVRQLNLLRPEFVVSVGDLIEGYTEDQEVLQREWTEFLGFIDQLEMKFFFVAGNHDLTNPVMHRIWRERFGPEWYSFDYQGVHFVCLSTEDPVSKIGDKQLNWLAQDLESHVDARWTLVFLHKPLWTYAEREMAAGNPDPTNWKRAEKLLGQRPHTVFAGHVHHYVQYERNGAKYYHLATTGGGSRLRGKPYGEFDHVVWLTMEKDGPRIANLLLDGVLAPDAVTEQSIARFRDFLDQSSIRIAPILIDTGEQISQGTIHLQLKNEFEAAVQLNGKIEGLPLRGLTLDSTPLTIRSEPGQTEDLSLSFQMQEPLHFEHFAQTTLTAKLRSLGDDPLSAELSVPVTIDWRYPCPSRSPVVDGRIEDWFGEQYALFSRPLVYGASDQWQGHADASIRFRVAHDEHNIYVSGEVTDDRVTDKDRVYVNFDCRAFADRVSEPELGEDTQVFALSAPIEGEEVSVRTVHGSGKGVKAAGQRTSGGYTFELAVPITRITDVQGTSWKSIQLTPALNDIDDKEDRACYIVWRGTRDLRRVNTNFAHFFRQ